MTLAAKISEAVTAQLPRHWAMADLDVEVAELPDAWRVTAIVLVRPPRRPAPVTSAGRVGVRTPPWPRCSRCQRK